VQSQLRQVGRDFQQRPQHKGSEMQARVRQGQLWQVQRGVVKYQQVQVQCAGRVVIRALAAMGMLDGLQRMQQFQRLHARAQGHHGVQVVGPTSIHWRAAPQ